MKKSAQSKIGRKVSSGDSLIRSRQEGGTEKKRELELLVFDGDRLRGVDWICSGGFWRTHTILLCADELRKAFRTCSDICVSSDCHAVLCPFFQVFQKVLGAFWRYAGDLTSSSVLPFSGGVLDGVLRNDPVL